MKPRRKRRDDSDTRRLLLEVAGQVFAEKGFAGATGQEICARAKVNVAAINYHFHGFDRLYAAVLAEAARRLPTADVIGGALAGETEPKEKARAIFTLLVEAMTGPLSASWVVRVIGREAVSPNPSRFFVAVQEREVRPKVRLLKGVVSEFMKLPADHPAVERGCFSMIAPCALLLLGNRKRLKFAFPRFGYTPQEAGAVVDHLVRFSLGGLAAIGEAARAAGRTSRKG